MFFGKFQLNYDNAFFASMSIHALIACLMYYLCNMRKFNHISTTLCTPHVYLQGGGAQGGGLLGPVQRFSGQDHDSHSTVPSHAIPMPFPTQA